MNAATHARTASRSRIRRIASTTVYRFGGVYSPACHSSHATSPSVRNGGFTIR